MDPDGRRTIDAADFHVGALTTALEDTELLEEIEFPYLPPGTGWGFEEVARRLGDFAIVAMGATITLSEGGISQARVAITGVGEVPMRIAAAEALLVGRSELAPELVDAVAAGRDGGDRTEQRPARLRGLPAACRRRAHPSRCPLRHGCRAKGAMQ